MKIKLINKPLIFLLAMLIIISTLTSIFPDRSDYLMNKTATATLKLVAPALYEYIVKIGNDVNACKASNNVEDCLTKKGWERNSKNNSIYNFASILLLLGCLIILSKCGSKNNGTSKNDEVKN